jgi:hypothetical protein
MGGERTPAHLCWGVCDRRQHPPSHARCSPSARCGQCSLVSMTTSPGSSTAHYALGYEAIVINASMTPSAVVEAIVASGVLPVASIHAPAPLVNYPDRGWNRDLNLASLDEVERELALRYTERSVDLAVETGARHVVVHLGSAGNVQTRQRTTPARTVATPRRGARWGGHALCAKRSVTGHRWCAGTCCRPSAHWPSSCDTRSRVASSSASSHASATTRSRSHPKPRACSRRMTRRWSAMARCRACRDSAPPRA